VKRSLGRKTLLTPVPVWVVGTYDGDGRPNMMAAAWTGICCSKPPSVYVSLREATYSFGAIVAQQAFTVNLPTAEQAVLVDYVGNVSGRDADKFAVTGLTAKRAGEVNAPIIVEFPINVECRLAHTLKVGLHTLFVGEIVDVQANEEVLDDNGRPSVKALQPFVFGATEPAYYALGERIGAAFDIGKALIVEP
jgi:flavin reductase (DIM6/NTAB) family NADH-FMN oxidoreductase RutF